LADELLGPNLVPVPGVYPNDVDLRGGLGPSSAIYILRLGFAVQLVSQESYQKDLFRSQECMVE